MLKKRTRRAPRRSYRKNPARTVADAHAARELALCYDNERAQQAQKESIINNLARKMAKGVYDKSQAVKLWEYAAKSGADAYAKQFGSHGDTGAKMFNAATRKEAARILEDENRDYVKERSEQFALKAKKHLRNPSRNDVRSGRLQALRTKLVDRFKRAKLDKTRRILFMKINRIERIMRQDWEKRR